MRLYAGRIIRGPVGRQIADSRELRDAIVCYVYPADHYCMVKIQGSDTLVKAWYNENWESTPQWLKPGNAVRITHPGGNKGRIEVAGHGFLLPTPIPGGSGAPAPATPGDAVLTGCAVWPANPGAMAAGIGTGTYRIDGVTYSLVGMIMPRTDIIMPRRDLVMGRVGDSVSFDAASATLFRYDSIVAGVDGRADVVKGTEFSAAGTIPDPPAAPADHVRLGWVLIYPNMTTVAAFDIDRLFTTPIASELRVATADQDLAWGDTTTTITISVRDQYGNVLTRGGTGYYVTIAWNTGNGTLSYGGVSQDESASLSFYMASSAIVTYTRNAVDPGDSSPTFSIDEEETGLSNATYILLRDALGELMF